MPSTVFPVHSPESFSFLSLPRWKTLFLIVAGFFALTFAIYAHSLHYAFVRWDDGMLIYENSAIREITPTSLRRIFTTYDPELYIPLTFFTYQIEYALVGTHPFLYHLDNLILHTLNALLAAWFVYLLSRRKWMALFVGLIFAVHPINVEAVEWASARKDVLSTFFGLASLIAYLYFREKGGVRLYMLSLLCFVLGLLSKVMVITLPVLLLLIDDKEGQLWNVRRMREKIPYVVLSILFGIIGLVGKRSVVASSPLSTTIIMGAKSAVFYIGKIFFPFHLSLLYPYTKEITITSPDFAIPVLIVLGLIGVALMTRRWTREIFFGIFLYFVTVAPTFLNFAKGGDTDVYFASDRYTYLPMIGILYATGILIFLFLERKPRSPRKPMNALLSSVSSDSSTIVLAIAASAVVLFFSVLAYQQSLVWSSTEELFLNVLRWYPESSHVAHNNIGNVYRLRGDLDGAIAEYKKAIAIKPHVQSLSNLGAAYRKKGMFSDAITQFNLAIRLDPTSSLPQYGLGLVYADQGNAPAAEAAYEKAIALKPEYEDAYTNLATVLMNDGKTDAAIADYQKALALDPYLVEAHYNLGIALTNQNRRSEAIDQYREAIRLQPAFTQAHINLGLLYYAGDMQAAARKEFQAVLQYDPTNTTAKSALSQMQ